MRNALRKRYRVKIAFGNDADNFVRAIQRFGQARGKKNIIGLTLGTGVGSGVIIDGKIFSRNGAPELGHTTIKFDAKPVGNYRNTGCIESFIGRKRFPKDPLEVYRKGMAGDAVLPKVAAGVAEEPSAQVDVARRGIV